MPTPLKELSPEIIEQIRLRYADPTVPVTAIMREFDISARVLYELASRERWPLRNPERAGAVRRALAFYPDDPNGLVEARRRRRPGRPSERTLLIRERAARAATIELVERDIQQLKSERPCDREKRARLLATLTRTLSDLRRQSIDAAERDERLKAAQQKNGNEPVPARSLDEVRQDFAARLLDYCRGRVPDLQAAGMALPAIPPVR
jgi:hypothetical protein